MNSAWFPDPNLVRQSEHLADLVYDDFNLQGTSYGRSVTDLGTIEFAPDTYESRIRIAMQSDVECYTEDKNQVLKRPIKSGTRGSFMMSDAAARQLCVAAEEGGWVPSRFASYYARQFGECPSETCKRPVV